MSGTLDRPGPAAVPAANLPSRAHAGRLPGEAAVLPGLLIALAIFALTEVVLVRAGLPPLLQHELWDTDSYMWLNRAVHLWQTGAWFDPVYPRIDPPAGFIQHWTRPLDVLILAGAAPLSWLLGFEDALFWWSALLSPLLFVATLPLLAWAVRPLVPAGWTWLVGLAFVFQPGVVADFLAGRPDHHSLLVLLFVAQLGLVLRLLGPQARASGALWTGIVGALAIWVSVQILPVVAITIVTLGLFWLIGERSLGRLLPVHALGLFGGLAAALLAERGLARLGEIAFDTLSIAHLLVFGLNLALWSALRVLQRRTALLDALAGRALCGVAGALGAVAVLALVEPGLFRGPMADIDPFYRTFILDRVKELAPVVSLSEPGGWSWRRDIAMPLIWLGIALPAVPYLVYLATARRGAERRGWVFVGLLALAFVPAAAAQIRWLSFADVALVVPYARLGAVALAWLSRRRLPAPVFGVLRPTAIALFGLWIFVPLGISKAAERHAAPGDPAAQGAVTIITRDMICPIRPLARVLSDPAGLGAEPKRILAFIDFGPELLYRTPHAVFSIPNHRSQPGLVATYRIMTATDYGLAERLLRARGVDLVLICPRVAGVPYVEQSLYATEAPGVTLYQALAAEQPPGFLTPVPLPAPLSETFKLYALRGAARR